MNCKKYERRAKVFHTFVIIWLLAFSSLSIADDDSQASQKLKQYISDSMARLLIKLEDNKIEYNKDSELFFNDLNVELSKLIDFKRIALKVMGKYVRTASSEQRERFIDIFKKTLFQTYAQVLLESSDVEISVLNASINARNNNKAYVNTVIRPSSGASYDVVYALHKDKDQIFRVENILVMGVNLGLAYKDRFHEQVMAQKGSIDSVINNWTFEEAT